MTFAERVINFNRTLRYTGGALPAGIAVLNPFEAGLAADISETFYRKFYSDRQPRSLILGINPGRFGAGLTGIPFTDPKRLVQDCGIPYSGKMTHEPSSVFIYEMIQAFGGPDAFYRSFYINSLFPLGFVKIDSAGREKNYNYYDDRELTTLVTPYIIENIRKQIGIGTYTNVCICFGTGKNEAYLRKLNAQYGFFKEIIGLEHPRFIMQYKSSNKAFYMEKYLQALNDAIASNQPSGHALRK